MVENMMAWVAVGTAVLGMGLYWILYVVGAAEQRGKRAV